VALAAKEELPALNNGDGIVVVVIEEVVAHDARARVELVFHDGHHLLAVLHVRREQAVPDLAPAIWL